MTWVQWAAVWFIVSVVASPFLGHWLHKRRTRIDRQRCARLEKLVELADEWDSAPTDRERQAIYRKAQLLGFTEEDEQNREWEGAAFSLDEDVQPHSDCESKSGHAR